ncbi:MAG TPA: (2Fe-2S)-binding protein [Acidimicrobiia bacterium]|nr:(2Fe-2S)-binding protein [Acidimicrobiia bacterium]
MKVTLNVNGLGHTLEVEPRRLLADVLRLDLGLVGTHLGCEHGVCGACTVLYGGRPVRSCLLFAVQCDDAAIRTVEGLVSEEGELHPVQQAFITAHGLQCGFCTPGFILAIVDLLEREPFPDDERIREDLSGNICRCTGYVNIVAAVREASRLMGRRDD